MNSTVDDALPVAVYAFGEFRLDVRRARLARGASDVPLTPKALAVLEFLVRRPGRVVDKEALLAAAWPNVVVEEGNVAQTIYLLRRALGEHPSDHRYIVTVPGRGYRFVADVCVVDDAPAATGVAVESAAIGSATVESAAMRIPEADALASPTLGAATADAATSVRRTARWTRAALAASVLLLACWGLFALVTASRGSGPVAASATSPPAIVAPDTRERTVASPDRRADREAKLAHARFLFARRAPRDLQRSRQAFEEMIASDPNDAAAWVGLAGVLYVDAHGGEHDRAAALAAAHAAAERAIAIDPGLAEAHARLATLRSCAGDERGARESLETAQRLAPNAPLLLARLAERAARSGDLAAAVQFAQRSVERDPLNLTLRMNVTAYLVAAGRPDEAEAEAQRIYEIHPLDDAAMLIGELRLARGDVQGAVGMFAGVRDPAERERARVLLSVVSRRQPDAEDALQRLAASVGQVDPFAVAEAYALHGDRNRAFEWLERAAPSDGRLGVAPGTRPRWSMPASPLLAQLHSDPRWPEWERAAAGGTH